MMKKWMLALLCLILTLTLAGCATVNSDNSFQNASTGEVSALPQTAETAPQGEQPAATQAPADTTAQPTGDPNAVGYNG